MITITTDKCPRDTDGDGNCHYCARSGGCISYRILCGELVQPIHVGDWVMERGSTRPTFGRVKRVEVDWLNIAVYSWSGALLGRVSPPMGGPTTYEPACSRSHYVRVHPPEFPLRKDFSGVHWEDLKLVISDFHLP